MQLIQIHPNDNVAVALEDLKKGSPVTVNGKAFTVLEDIGRGHKMALIDIPAGSPVRKYGNEIGIAKVDISTGAWVHTHNVKTGLSENAVYEYHHQTFPLPSVTPKTFNGFRRPDGRAAIRNELWIIPTVGCVNSIAGQLVKENQSLVSGTVDGLYTFPHPFGCSQLGADHAQTKKLLAALVRHPNAGGVLVLGLGCENLTMEQFKEELGTWDDRRVKFLICQDVEDELAAGSALLKELAEYAGTFKREPIPASELVIGMKCGGSDGLSGITANPTVGRFSDRLIALGGSTVLTEVPEMFGAESILFSRCENEAVFDKAVKMVNDFKKYLRTTVRSFTRIPPRQQAGGITTLETSPAAASRRAAAPRSRTYSPTGNPCGEGTEPSFRARKRMVSTTALTAAGVHMILFTTGRGTPFGAPAPTVKISTNTALFEKKGSWIDFNAGTVAENETPDSAGSRLLDFVLEVAGGKKTRTEERGYREISIFKDGVVL